MTYTTSGPVTRATTFTGLDALDLSQGTVGTAVASTATTVSFSVPGGTATLADDAAANDGVSQLAGTQLTTTQFRTRPARSRSPWPRQAR